MKIILKNLVGFWLLKISHQFFNILALLILNIAFWLDLATKKKAVYQESLRAHPPPPFFLAQGLFYADWSWAGLSRVYEGYQYGY